MTRNRPKPVTCVIYDDGHGLTVCLKYDHKRQIQRVYLNGKLKSSLERAPLSEGVHKFQTPADEVNGETQQFAYQVWMAYETFSERLRYDIRRSVVGQPSYLTMCLQCNIDTSEIDRWGLW